MSITDKIFGKSDAEILKEKTRKKTEKKLKKQMTIAEYYATLEACKRSFNKTISVERLNVLVRREKRMSDGDLKSRIHDAAIGLIAIEEAEIGLQSASQASDFKEAQKKLAFVLRQMGKLDPNASITKKDIKEQTGFTFDDSNETERFVDRANMVDEQFVEYLIQGLSMEECISKKNLSAEGTLPFDFSSGNSEVDTAYIDQILQQNADDR